MSASAPAPGAKGDQGILVTATKVVVPFKTELINTIATPRFEKRAPHLVGILATKKEDARFYAEVSVVVVYDCSATAAAAAVSHTAWSLFGRPGWRASHLAVPLVPADSIVHQEGMREDWHQL